MATELMEALLPGVPDPDRESWIRKTPGVCGGDACIRKTRMPVWLLVQQWRLGETDEDIRGACPFLSAADLQAARHYSAAHTAEIERAILENQEA